MDKAKLILSTLMTSLVMFFSPVTPLLVPALWLILLDILTGIYVARIVLKQPLTSRAFFRKLPQFLMFLVALAASLHADPFLTQFGLEQYQTAKLVISFYGLYELFSILENLGKSGLPVAKQLATMLQAKLPDEAKEIAKSAENDNKP